MWVKLFTEQCSKHLPQWCSGGWGDEIQLAKATRAAHMLILPICLELSQYLDRDRRTGRFETSVTTEVAVRRTNLITCVWCFCPGPQSEIGWVENNPHRHH